MSNIITVDLSRGRKVETSTVFQWNHGMTLRFIRATLPEIFRVDFSNSTRGKAKSMIGSASGGVVIPDEYFMPGSTIYAWVVLFPTENSAVAEWQISIPIDPKAKATDEEPTPQQESVIDQTINALNTAVAEAQEAITHYPKVVDGYWYVWDVTDSEYVTTGVKSTGEDGVSPVVTVESITGGHRVTITDANGDHVFDVLDGVNGDPGRGIATIAKTGTSGLTDTYTITYTDGTTQTYSVVNGADGTSPTIVVSSITGGHRLTITDAQGTQTVDVLDGADGDDGRGIVSIEKTGTAGLVDTYTITYTSGDPTTFTVTNGKDGTDGYSPTASVSKSGSTATITITDKQGTTTAQVSDGEPGPGVPAGGTTGQMLVKKSDTDYDGEWTNPPSAPVTDVQVNGTSILNNGVANVPVASGNDAGVIRMASNNGLFMDGTIIRIKKATDGLVKSGDSSYFPIVPANQNKSVFYGLAKAAGDSTQSASSNPVGTYTESAKSAISQMLDAPETVSGSTPSITAKAGVRYVCGECATLDITLPASGCVDVVFESGSTPTVLTITPPTGVTVKWADGWDETCEANTTYEINILNGELGVKAAWT